MIKRILIFSFLFFILAFPVYAEGEISVSAEGAALIVAENGELIFGKNENRQLSMASTTKIMTSLLLIEENAPAREITVSKPMVSVEGTSMGLMPGDRVTYEALAYGMLLESGNDAANAAAYAVAGSPEKFALLMNKKAREIGMKNTNFVTPSGLDAKEHYSCAYDMALLGAYAVKNPEFVNVCSQRSKMTEFGNPPHKRRLSNHNRLLSMCDGAFGVKTGFTKKSGRCLVSAVRRDGVTLVAVTLNAPDDWNDHMKMYDYGFSKVKKYEIKSEPLDITVPVIGGNKESISLKTADEPLFYPSIGEDTAGVTSKVFTEKFLYAPVKKGDIVGEIKYYSSGREIFSVPVFSAEDIACITKEIKKPEKKSLKQRIADLIKKILNLKEKTK